MAPNGTSRKTPAAAPKPVKTDDSSSIPLDSLFDDLENTKAKVKEDVRKVLPALDKPGSWDSKVTGGAKQADKENAGPPMNKIPTNLAKAFASGRLMADRPDVLKCNVCKRPVLKHAMPAHIEQCLNKKQEKQRKKKEAKDARDAAARKEKSQDAEDDDDVAGEDGAGKKTTNTASAAGKNTLGLTASKKRKLPDDPDEAPGGPNKKKKKKDAQDKTKLPRPKAPVDVERQCGVELPQGGQCARSLTCKSHSMGAKRGVPGRSAPYDKLLMEYQRKNAAKLQKAQFEANAPDPEDERADAGGPVDEGEETAAVLAGIGRAWGGEPLGRRIVVPLRARYQVNRIRGTMASAMVGVGGGSAGFFGGGGSGGGTGFFTGAIAPPVQPPEPKSAVDGGAGHVRRGSVVPGARSMMAPMAGRKASAVAAS